MLRKRSPSSPSPAPGPINGWGIGQKIRDPHWHAAFLFAAVGLGVGIHCALRWQELPHYSPADIEHSAQLNLAIDQARPGAPQVVTADQREQSLERERGEIQGDIAQEKQGIHAEAGLALVLLVLAAGQTVAARLNARRRSG